MGATPGEVPAESLTADEAQKRGLGIDKFAPVGKPIIPKINTIRVINKEEREALMVGKPLADTQPSPAKAATAEPAGTVDKTKPVEPTVRIGPLKQGTPDVISQVNPKTITPISYGGRK